MTTLIKHTCHGSTLICVGTNKGRTNLIICQKIFLHIEVVFFANILKPTRIRVEPFECVRKWINFVERFGKVFSVL